MTHFMPALVLQCESQNSKFIIRILRKLQNCDQSIYAKTKPLPTDFIWVWQSVKYIIVTNRTIEAWRHDVFCSSDEECISLKLQL